MKKAVSFLCLFAFILTFQSGCSMWNTTFKNDQTTTLTPRADQPYMDDTELSEEENDWAFVGNEGRGTKKIPMTPRKQSFVDKYLKTETTRQIEANLGVYE